MNLLRTLGRIAPVMPEVTAYHTFVKASGTSVKMETLQALDRFVRDCYNAGVWTKLLEVYPLCGDDLTAAMVKLKNVPIAPALTSVNFVAGDYAERGVNGGLLGNGTTKYLDTNFHTSNLPSAAHLSVYLREDVSTPSYWLGANDGALTNIVHLGSTAGTNRTAIMGSTAAAIGGAAPAKGFYYTERGSPTDLTLYKDNVSQGTSATNVGAVTPYPSMNVYAFARNNNGAPTSYTNKRMSFISIGLPLTAAERTAFYAAVVALQTNLERNV